MSRVKKPADLKLNDSINTPVNRCLKRRVKAVAAERRMFITALARSYIERCVEQDEKELSLAK